MRKLPLYRFAGVLLSIVCMVIIFCLSGENAEESSDTSGNFTQIAVDIFVGDYDEMTPVQQEEILSWTDHIVRKLAHFSIYAALGVCVSLAAGRRKLFSFGSLISAAVCFIYACSDELHQSFIPGRSCEFKDVLIDTSGSVLGILISLAIMTIIFRLSDMKQSSGRAC